MTHNLPGHSQEKLIIILFLWFSHVEPIWWIKSFLLYLCLSLKTFNSMNLRRASYRLKRKGWAYNNWKAAVHKRTIVSAPLWLVASAEERRRSYWLVVWGRNVWLSSSSVEPDVAVVRCVNQLASVYWPSKMFVTTVFIMVLVGPGPPVFPNQLHGCRYLSPGMRYIMLSGGHVISIMFVLQPCSMYSTKSLNQLTNGTLHWSGG